MAACLRGGLLTRRIQSRSHIFPPTLQPFQKSSAIILLTLGTRGLTNKVSSDSNSSEGPQSKEKTENAKQKIENDPRMKDVDDLIRDKYALIRDEEYRTCAREHYSIFQYILTRRRET